MKQSYLAPVNCKASSLSDPKMRTGWTQPGSLRPPHRGLSMWAKAFLAPPSALVRGPAPASLQLKPLSAERGYSCHLFIDFQDVGISLYPCIRTSKRFVLESNSKPTSVTRPGVVIFTGTRLIAFGSHQSLPVVRRGRESVRRGKIQDLQCQQADRGSVFGRGL